MALLEGCLILGINSAYHEIAAAIVRDGEVVCAIEEERFTRIKHAKSASVSNPDQLPWNAIRACLQAVPGATLRDLNTVAYSLEPGRALWPWSAAIHTRSTTIQGFGTRAGEEEFNTRVLSIPSLLAAVPRVTTPLPDAFASYPIIVPTRPSAVYTSPFRHAAILVIDGIGETDDRVARSRLGGGHHCSFRGDTPTLTR